MRALDDLVRAGKVRYLGVSDTPAWKVAEANVIARFRGWSAFIGLQIEYSLLERTVEHELVPMALELGLGRIQQGRDARHRRRHDDAIVADDVARLKKMSTTGQLLHTLDEGAKWYLESKP